MINAKAGSGWRMLKVTTHLYPHQLSLFRHLNDWSVKERHKRTIFYRVHDKFILDIDEGEYTKLTFIAKENILKQIISRLWLTSDFELERNYILVYRHYRNHLVLALGKFINEWQLLNGDMMIYKILVLPLVTNGELMDNDLTVDDWLLVGLIRMRDELGKMPHSLTMELKSELKTLLRFLGVQKIFVIPKGATRSARILRKKLVKLAKSLGWKS